MRLRGTNVCPVPREGLAQVLASRGCSQVTHRIRCGPANAEIGKAVLDHGIGIVEVAAINDDRITKSLIEPVDVQIGELSPIGQDEQSVGIFGRGVGVGLRNEDWRRREGPPGFARWRRDHRQR